MSDTSWGLFVHAASYVTILGQEVHSQAQRSRAALSTLEGRGGPSQVAHLGFCNGSGAAGSRVVLFAACRGGAAAQVHQVGVHLEETPRRRGGRRRHLGAKEKDKSNQWT